MRFYICFIFLLILVIEISAQLPSISNNRLFRKEFDRAEGLLNDERYKDAIDAYLTLLEKDTSYSDIYFKIGFCFLNLKFDRYKSIDYFKKAIEKIDPTKKSKNAPIEVYYYLGYSYHLNYQFNKAIEVLDSFKINNNKLDELLLSYVDKEIEECKSAKEIIKDTVKVQIKNLGKSINTQFSEHSPIISVDDKMLIFTSKRKAVTSLLASEEQFEKKTDTKNNNIQLFITKITPDGQYNENIYYSVLNDSTWSPSISIGGDINTTKNVSACCISSDKQQLIIYIEGDLYISKLNGTTWAAPQKMPFPINTKYKETHASLSADNKYLYFSSNRLGGFGGLDIYVSEIDNNGQWGDPKNLGPEINTLYDEEGPCIHPDGITLFFSSKGHNTMGGYDIFSSIIQNDGKWSKSKNIGFPVNTVDSEVFFKLSTNGKMAYFSSERPEGYGNTDIYSLFLYEEKEKDLMVLTGKINSENGNIPAELKIKVTDLDSTKNNYFSNPNSKTGEYTVVVKPDKNYNVLVEAKDHLFQSDKFPKKDSSGFKKVEKNINLNPIEEGKTKQSYDLVFNEGSVKLDPQSEYVLENIVSTLKTNQILLLDISSSATITDTLIILKRKEYIERYIVEKGITQDRILTDSTIAEIAENVVQLTIIDKISTAKYIDDKKELSNELKKRKFATDFINGKMIQPANAVVVKDILFDYDLYTAFQYVNEVEKLAKYLIEEPAAKIRINGHTDSKGNKKYNRELSARRAMFVEDYLLQRGVNSYQFATAYMSDDSPIAINTDENGNYVEESQKLNRRVEFTILKQGRRKQLVVEPIAVPDKYKVKVETTEESDIFYSILLKASTKQVETDKFGEIKDLKEFIGDNGIYYYYTGKYYKLYEAEKVYNNEIKDVFPKAIIFLNEFENIKHSNTEE